MSQDTLLEDLVVSMLAVNNLRLEKVFRLRDGLAQQGFFNPKTVAGWDHATACERLKAAGYDRGPYYGSILASRLQELAAFADKGGLDQVRESLRADHRDAAEKILLGIHGVGPAVMRNFWVLQGSEDAQGISRGG